MCWVARSGAQDELRLYEPVAIVYVEGEVSSLTACHLGMGKSCQLFPCHQIVVHRGTRVTGSRFYDSLVVFHDSKVNMIVHDVVV